MGLLRAATFGGPPDRRPGRRVARPRRRGGERAHRRHRHRSHRRRSNWSRPRPTRIQVSAAPGADGIVRRMQQPAREGSTNWAVFALANSGDEQIDRLIVVPHYRMVGSGLLLARSRPVAHRHHHAELGRAPGAAGQRHRRHLPHHARSRHGHHLRRRAAHRPAAAALSVGAGRLQGQGQQLHALPRHRHRHRRPAGAVPDHPVRGQGQRDVPGRRRARLGGAGLYRHRLRLLGQGVRHVVGRRAHLARVRRGDPRRHAAGVPVRLSQSQPLARALHAHHDRLARRAWRRWWRSRCSIRRSPPASRGCRSSASRSSASALVVYLSTHGYDRAVLLIPTWFLLVVWAIALV